MDIILYFLVTMVESGLETSHSASNSTYGERACFIVLKLMLMGSRYHICTILVLFATVCPYPRYLAKVVPRGKIFINASNPKHAA